MGKNSEHKIDITNALGVNFIPAIWVALLFIMWHLARIAAALEKMAK